MSASPDSRLARHELGISSPPTMKMLRYHHTSTGAGRELFWRHFVPETYTGLGSDISFSKAGKMPAFPGKSAHEMKLFTLNRYNMTWVLGTYPRLFQLREEKGRMVRRPASLQG